MATMLDSGASTTSIGSMGIRGLATQQRAQQEKEQRELLARSAFDRHADSDGTLPVDYVSTVLDELGLQSDAESSRLLQNVANGAEAVDFQQLLALMALLSQSSNTLGPDSPSTSTIGASKTPLKKVLTKNRYYLETGQLSVDAAVLDYIHKLDEHRKRCEVDGRYGEAKAAAKRLADLKTAQVERLRAELVMTQNKELEEVHRVYEDETAKFQVVWDGRIADFEQTFSKAVDDLKASHGSALLAMAEEADRKKPQAPRPSKDYLNQRTIQDKLAKSKLYIRASKVKEAADELYTAEMGHTLANWEADTKLKLGKLQNKQQQEFEAMLQRGSRGRDELERRRTTETERRTFRFRNIVAELEGLHNLEVVHLESFLDGQVQAGKASAPTYVGYRRKREQLLSSQF